MSEAPATFESPSESATAWYIHMKSMPKSTLGTEVVKAIAQIRYHMKRPVVAFHSSDIPSHLGTNSCSTVTIYSFNIDEDGLKLANALLDKLQGRKSMRFITISLS